MIKNILVFFLLIVQLVRSDKPNILNSMRILKQCIEKTELLKCLKIEALKMVNRGSNLGNIQVSELISLVPVRNEVNMRQYGLTLNDTKLQRLDNEDLDNLLSETSKKFLNSHQLEIKFPKSDDQSRKIKSGGGKGGGGGTALYWALAIKGTFLAMAYNGIAAMSGIALIMGKMALLLTAILGLKKLVSAGEKTTVEIVKKPKYSESHVYSTSYEEEEEDYHKSHYDRSDNVPKILRMYL